ncbi:MAG TPA: hypothetical protein VFE58_06470 [Tepidisphaeraceae bacterium]|jgi:pimeloyl-ACP methyl ester carboxylesterase|nr:hypothetical protein [Tepidisphaeraceae bacterium]
MRYVLSVMLLMLLGAAPTTRPAVYLIHLPGISGPLAIDRAMSAGVKLAGLPKPLVFDWTVGDPGLHALTAYGRNQEQAKILADRLTTQYRAHPDVPIEITAHSGGTAVAVWALEKCPADVKVQTVLLIASALSPTYDLSDALAHVCGKVYAFYSPFDDIVLGTGTKTLGTMDRVYTQAAGMVGFTQPTDAKEPAEYKKLIGMPYKQEWMKLGNRGDHIGAMGRVFAAEVLAPLLGGEAPELVPATKPSR